MTKKELIDQHTSYENIFKTLGIKNLDSYEWSTTSDDNVILFEGNEIYRESKQHVSAASKLLRIPEELWLAWATIVLVESQNKPLDLSLDVRIQVFKKAFSKTIEPYLFTKDFSSKKVKDPCVACGNNNYSEGLNRFVNGKEFFVLRCENCGLGVRYPRPKAEELSKIYMEDYFSGDSTERGYFDYAQEATWRIEKGKNYLKKIEEVTDISPNTTKVLDLGSGYGYFLKALEEKNYDALGIELAPDAVEFANKEYKTKTLEGDLEVLLNEGKIKKESFGLVTLWDVIEHFYDVSVDIDTISQVLEKNGYVALRTNNLSSIEFEVFGKYFHSIKYEHTFYYNDESLTKLFDRVGIKSVKTWTHTHLFLAFMTKEEIEMVNMKNKGGDIFFVGQKS